MNVLFVCTGNICRSPIAERLSLAWATTHGIDDLTASSAGTRAVVGSPMETTAAQVLSSMGGTPEGFTARQINPMIASSADLVLTMTEAHRDAVLKISPRQLKRTFTLMEASHLARALGRASVAELSAARGSVGRLENADVPDPIGRSAIVFEDVGSQIESALLGLLPRLNG